MGNSEILTPIFVEANEHTVDGRNPAPPGMVKNPINNGIIIILGGAGFCPSTVWAFPKPNKSAFVSTLYLGEVLLASLGIVGFLMATKDGMDCMMI